MFYEKVSFFLMFSLEKSENAFNIFLYRSSIKLKSRFFLIFFRKKRISSVNNV